MRPVQILLITSAVVLSGIVQAQAPDNKALVKEVAPERVAAMVAENKVIVYDCNEEETYAEAHVPGAILIVYDEVTVDKLPADRGIPLVFYCYSPECPAGASAAATAIQLGYTDVYSMTAGIIGWQDAGFATEP